MVVSSCTVVTVNRFECDPNTAVYEYYVFLINDYIRNHDITCFLMNGEGVVNSMTIIKRHLGPFHASNVDIIYSYIPDSNRCESLCLPTVVERGSCGVSPLYR